MRPSTLLYMYMRRLRAHGMQELFAAIGIAIAVALVLAALLAEGSISRSAGQVVHTVVGPADLQLRARSGEGFDEAVLARVKRLPGVRDAAPLLEQTATIAAGNGRRVRVQLAGADVRLAVLDGLGETLPLGTLSSDAVGLSEATANALKLSARTRRRSVTLMLRGHANALPISAVLGARQAGALANALVAVMPLRRMQQLARLPGRISRVLVRTRSGHRAAVRAELERLAAGRLEVAPANQDVRLLEEALGPSDLASGLFAAIGALLGFLLAFNAMLLTVSDRRRTIADLRISGAGRATIVEMVLFEALCLGIVASALGLGAGYLLSIGVFHQSTDYLAEAFTLSPTTVVGTRAVLVSLGGGVLATCLASTVPLLDLRPSRPRDAIYQDGGVPGNSLSAGTRRRLAALGLLLLAGASALWIEIPAAAIAATALLALSTVLAVPLAFAGVLRVAGALSERLQRVAILPLALASLRATTVRSLALAATGAVALFGSVALGGSRENLLEGIDSFARSYVADADIWISNPGDNQAVESFDGGSAATRIARLPPVASVQAFEGGFVQLGKRRVWVVARPPQGADRVLESQIRTGDLSRASARLARGGWIAVSDQIAAEHHVGLGGTLALPTPSGPRRLRVAAITTNLAWPPGVVFMGAADFAGAWHSANPSALGVRLRPGAAAGATRAQIERVLGPASGLEVSLAAERAAKIEALASEGLGQLRVISLLLLIAAVVAMVAALGSSIWQRRASLAGLRLLGARPWSLQAILLLEAALMLGAGCVTGALAGAYGQVVIDGFLRHVTGFPLASSTSSARPVEIFALVLALALAVGALPAWLAAHVRHVVALADE